MKNNSDKSSNKSIRLGIYILIGLIVYAYGFNVTGLNFAKTREEQRLTSFRRVLRALAHPHVFDFDKEEQFIEVPFYLPCPEEGAELPEQDTSQPYVVMVGCGEAREFIEIEGFNFWPEASGPINFLAASDQEEGVKLTLENITTDEEGHFTTSVQLPNRLPKEEAQAFEIKVRRNVGTPYFSSMAVSTWEAIIETIFTALLATTFGLLLAIPVSFIAAKNLMVMVKNPLTATALAILSWPLGIGAGILVTRWVQSISAPIFENTGGLVIAAILLPVIGFYLLRWALPQDEVEIPSRGLKTARMGVVVLTTVLGIVFLLTLANLGFAIGEFISDINESLAFVGGFIFQLGDMLQMILPVIVALAGGAAIGNLGQRLGQQIADKMSANIVKIFNIVSSSLAFGALFALIGAGLDWFYQYNDLSVSLYWPGGIGMVIGLMMALTIPPKQPLPTGLIIYYVTRGILNITRSVEPLIMVIVAVIWVGIGPFAGSLALALHTIAALAKLFSEQVESILPGPLEAIQATGANRLQTIVYAVVPQIIPPYISFTMYRWDINVRMSTIIGFAGGGGIGFLLQQNIAIFSYRDASVQMLAIAITVATMDYVSSVLRERFV